MVEDSDVAELLKLFPLSDSPLSDRAETRGSWHMPCALLHPRLSMKARVLIATIAGVLLGGGVLVCVRNRDRMPDGLTVVNGRIEGDPVVVAAKVPGRLVTLLVKEGDVVEIGQSIGNFR